MRERIYFLTFELDHESDAIDRSQNIDIICNLQTVLRNSNKIIDQLKILQVVRTYQDVPLVKN